MRLAGVPVGMSATFVPGTFVQISWTTALPVSNTRMSTTEALAPARLVAVSATWKLPASEGVPLMTPLRRFRARPGGRPFAVKPRGALAPVTVKLNGWPRKATALNGLVRTAGALDPAPPIAAVLVGYRRVFGMASSAWLGLYQ